MSDPWKRLVIWQKFCEKEVLQYADKTKSGLQVSQGAVEDTCGSLTSCFNEDFLQKVRHKSALSTRVACLMF